MLNSSFLVDGCSEDWSGSYIFSMSRHKMRIFMLRSQIWPSSGVVPILKCHFSLFWACFLVSKVLSPSLYHQPVSSWAVGLMQVKNSNTFPEDVSFGILVLDLLLVEVKFHPSWFAAFENSSSFTNLNLCETTWEAFIRGLVAAGFCGS